MNCHCDPARITSYWLHRQWHAANPGVRPTPWEAPRAPLYHATPPGPLMARLCITFPLHDGRFVSYPRQEAPMPATAAYDALCAEFHQEVMLYLEMQLHAGARERRIRELWAQIKDLEATQQGGRA